MKASWLSVSLFVCMSSLCGEVFAQYTSDQYDWQTYGDWYPTTARAYSDVVTYMDFEGPGNRNPGNYWGYPQGDRRLQVPAELRTYMAREFKYVWFNMDSFADRDSVTHEIRHLMTYVYHAEAESLRAYSHGNLIVLPYFSFTISRSQFPWYSALQESWFLHKVSNPSERISPGDLPPSDRSNSYIGNWIKGGIDGAQTV